MSKKSQTAANIEQVIEVAKVERDMTALMEQFGGVKSKAIRFLASEGLKTAEITKLMQSVFPKFIYQHARNVLNQKVKES